MALFYWSVKVFIDPIASIATKKERLIELARESHILTVIMCYILISSYFLSFSLRRKAMCGKSTVV
jgi:hypothetical protein